MNEEETRGPVFEEMAGGLDPERVEVDRGRQGFVVDTTLQRGDVLVTMSTSAAFNVVLPLLGGLLTERGGALSHAAIVAREYGIPAVMGTGDGTTALTTGARVIVDGDHGRVLSADDAAA